ncbi:MAG: hypothetical protein CMP33_00590 [Rickettsiales bacterium]|nr:hypothetical protein [Rickettsiales bacterium]
MTNRGLHIRNLEYMITTSCDLACPGCDRFIDHGHAFVEKFEDIVANMEQWFKRLDPDHVTIIGGEPLLHPRIYDILTEARRIFDHAVIEVYTNAFLLPKRPKIFNVLKKIGNAKVSCSIHNKNPKYRDIVERNLHQAFYSKGKWFETSQNTHTCETVVLEVTDPTQGGWYDYRRVVDGVLKPWNDNDPTSSYKHCGVNIYPIIYKNKLYKCPPISMVRTHLTKNFMLEDKDWEPYLKYEGLDPDCDEKELEKFVKNIYEPHSICSMCPAKPVLKPQEEAVVKNVKI